MPEISIEERARVFSALADPTRLRLVEILACEHELCGTQIAHRAGISIALLSHHWKVLSEAGLVVRRRDGQRQYCRLNCDKLEAAFANIWPRSRLQSTICP